MVEVPGSGGPTIEPVEQVTLDAIRPGPGWYWVGLTVAVVGLVGSFLVLTVGAFGYVADIDGLQRVEVGSTERLELAGGALAVFHEPAGGGVVGLGGVTVTARPDAGGVPVVAASAGARTGELYDLDGRFGVRVGDLEVPVAGAYDVAVEGQASGRYAIGPSPEDRLTGLVIVALVAAFLAVGGGAGTIAVTWFRRRRSLRSRYAAAAT